MLSGRFYQFLSGRAAVGLCLHGKVHKADLLGANGGSSVILTIHDWMRTTNSEGSVIRRGSLSDSIAWPSSPKRIGGWKSIGSGKEEEEDILAKEREKGMAIRSVAFS